jgi:hypothetical protein
MTMNFAALFSLLMAARLPFTYDDRRIGPFGTVFFILALLSSLALTAVSPTWFALAAVNTALIGLTLAAERFAGKVKRWRLITLAAAVGAYGLLTGLAEPLEFNQAAAGLRQFLLRFDIVGSLLRYPWTARSALVILAGFLFQLNEANLIVRTLLDALHFSPGSGSRPGLPAAAQVNPQPEIPDEYQAGRVIGILERSFAYLALLTGRPSIFGFILAAKAFARFKEMENKAYAEYVLIGTMSSVFLAVVVSEVVLLLLP